MWEVPEQREVRGMPIDLGIEVPIERQLDPLGNFVLKEQGNGDQQHQHQHNQRRNNHQDSGGSFHGSLVHLVLTVVGRCRHLS
jgi:hypothetical protein